MALKIFIISCLIFGLVIVSNLTNFNKYKLLLVQSGSMAPSINTGDLILIKKYPKYLVNDVVTFHDKNRQTVTHRINDIKGKNFITKGDANLVVDSENIKLDQILGKVVYNAPKIGYLVSFAKTKTGIILLIIVPAVLIVLGEINNILRYLFKSK